MIAKSDGCVDVDTNHYSVPWKLIGMTVSVLLADGIVRVTCAGVEVARHAERHGRRERAIQPEHLAGIVGHVTDRGAEHSNPPLPAGELLRPLVEYEQVVGGSW